MGRVVALFVLLTLAACVGMAPKVEGVRTIGIVSAIGDKFYLRKVGLTVFGNESEEMGAESWGIDDVMTAKIRTALGSRFDVRPVTYRRAAFSNVQNKISLVNEPLRGETVRAEVSPQGLDAYLIVTKSDGAYKQTNQILTGLGMVEGFQWGENLVYAYAYYALALVDGHEWTVSRNTYASVPDEPGPFGPRFKLPSRTLDKSWWPTSRDAASNQRLKGVVVGLIDDSVPATLQKMQLVQ